MRRSFPKFIMPIQTGNTRARTSTCLPNSNYFVFKNLGFEVNFPLSYVDRAYVSPSRRKVINTEFDCKWKGKTTRKLVHFNFGQYLDTVCY